jgi:hypothetical protein
MLFEIRVYRTYIDPTGIKMKFDCKDLVEDWIHVTKGQRQVVDSCEHSSDPSGSIKDQEFRN